MRLVEQNDQGHYQHTDDDEETHSQKVVPVEESLGYQTREANYDSGEDYQRYSVAYPPLGYQLTQPDQEHGAGSHGQDRGQGRE